MTDLEKPTTIEFDPTDHVATVTLNRPERLNSFNRTMADELSTVWARVRDDEDIRVAVLRASGDRAFCTGIDVAEGRWWLPQPIFNQEEPFGHQLAWLTR
jgi:E-phenylitaconyl-CoA hydratase